MIASGGDERKRRRAEKQRERMARQSRADFSSVSDIGELPAVADQKRRDKCRGNLELYLQTYFPNSTGISPFSPDHKRVIARLQLCILEGGRFINAVYRGFAKTTIAIGAAIWAASYGHRRYVAIFSANEPQADDLIASIKSELSENELLYEDFPEVCHAFRALEGKPQRCASQTYGGQLTHIGYRADRVIMPYIEGSVASGAILASRGMTGSGTRGLLHTTPDGTKQRPDFCIIDDPQTNESASTLLQVNKRLDIIRRSILKLAGHNRPMACVVNATVIAADDVVEQLLDPKRNPAWQGERIKMVNKWADAHESFWLGPYADTRNGFDRNDPLDRARAHAAATELYRANRLAYDAGCEVSWDYCFGEGEISAIQHAYNMLIDDGADVFATECQNEAPKPLFDANRLTAREIAERTNGFPRYQFPAECEYVTAFIDVQGALLYYLVAAWSPTFTGFVVDYGTWPDQGRRYFRLREAQRTLQTSFPGMGNEAQIYQGITALVSALASRTWTRADGASLSLGKLLIDANWGMSTKAVKRFCQTSEFKHIALPSHGQGVTAAQFPFSERNLPTGGRRGLNWMLVNDKEGGGLRHVSFETNFWKSFVHARLRVLYPANGSLSLWGNDPRAHDMLSDHLTAEFPTRTEGRGRTVDQWSLIPNSPDNHLFDCLVGCAVGASMLGASLAEHAKKPKPNRVPLSKMGRA